MQKVWNFIGIFTTKISIKNKMPVHVYTALQILCYSKILCLETPLYKIKGYSRKQQYCIKNIHIAVYQINTFMYVYIRRLNDNDYHY